MRIDLFSIFPAYFDALDLSLAGKARDDRAARRPRARPARLDPRPAPHRRRHAVRRRRRHGDEARAVGRGARLRRRRPVRAPRWSCRRRPGRRSPRRSRASWPTREHLVFACGRYEGIDQRVADDAAARFEVLELSVGDYVLNGGEVAALAICEAVVAAAARVHGQPRVAGRGVARGRPARGAGLHQARVVARPRRPAGAAQRRPRRDRAVAPASSRVRRTAQRRPDLLSPSVLLEDVVRAPGRARRRGRAAHACSGRAGCRRSRPTPGVPIPALEESLDDVRALDPRGHGPRRRARTGGWSVRCAACCATGSGTSAG